MMGHNVVHLAELTGGWTDDELSVLRRMQKAYCEAGTPTECELGMSDEGSPWAAFYDRRDEAFVGHVARDRRQYILICSDRTVHRTGRMELLVSAVRRHCHLFRIGA
jgi:hypothetical protein